jgi:hypothetical protein
MTEKKKSKGMHSKPRDTRSPGPGTKVTWLLCSAIPGTDPILRRLTKTYHGS